ncbi:MAG: hypothetical protein R6V14_04620 [Halanaerobiales bacterium]
MEKLIKFYAGQFELHSQTRRGIVQQYYNNLKSFLKSKGKASNPQLDDDNKKYWQ